jgi:hypothetical protein
LTDENATLLPELALGVFLMGENAMRLTMGEKERSFQGMSPQSASILAPQMLGLLEILSGLLDLGSQLLGGEEIANS